MLHIQLGYIIVGLCNMHHGHQKGVAEEGLGEQQKLIIY